MSSSFKVFLMFEVAANCLLQNQNWPTAIYFFVVFSCFKPLGSCLLSVFISSEALLNFAVVILQSSKILFRSERCISVVRNILVKCVLEYTL